MKNVQLYDKSFKLYMSYEEIQKAIDEVAEKSTTISKVSILLFSWEF